METWVDYAPLFGLAGVIFALFLFHYMKSFPRGNETMVELEEMIHAGAMAFLKREYSILIIFIAVVVGLLWFGINWQTAAAFLSGAFCSGLAGYTGMNAATRANARTAEAANKFGIAEALNVSYFGGAVMGIVVASFGLIGVGAWYYYVGHDPKTAYLINGFAMGASSIALFARMGGGIYTKAADAPMACMNCGRIAVAISWQKSLRRLVRPNKKTSRLNDPPLEASCFPQLSRMASFGCYP